MIKKNKKKMYFIIELLIVAALFIGVSNLLSLNIFAHSIETEDPAIFEENYYYKVSDSELMRLSKDKVEGLWLPAEPSVCGPQGIPVDDPAAMVSSGGEYIPSEFQRSEGLGLSYIAPNEGLFLKYLKEYTLEMVIPPDDRVGVSDTTVFPWITIVKLYIIAADGTQLTATGAIIDDFHVLTAGHCVWSHDYGDNWVQSIMVVPGLDGSYMPFYYAWKTNCKTYTGWVVNRDPDHDWAVITLDRNIGSWTGWMGRETHSDLSWYSGTTFNTAGYPADLSSGLVMYFDADIADYATDYRLYYYMDTAGGQSGSPVWAYSSTAGRRIVAIHAYGSSTINSGTRLNQDKFDRIITWLDDDGSITDYADLIDDGQYWSGFSSDNPNPAEVRAGEPFSVWNDVRNIGTEHSGSFTVCYYASTNDIISPSDYLIGTCSVSSISPFSWDDSDWSGPFPGSIPTGVYYVGWIIDCYDDVTEFDEGNNIACCEDGTLTVLLGGSPPQVTTNNASGVTSNSAQLNGNLDSTGGLSCQVWFEYGKTTSYGSSTTKQPKSTTGPFDSTISSLDSNTTYHFRAKASNTAGSDDGADRIFTTLANAPGTAAFSNVTTNSIRANWTANGNPAGTQYYCENTTKGTNSGWTSNLDWNSTGLSEDTTYHFQVKAKNGDGIETGWTNLGSQKTDIGNDPPQVTTNNASGVTSTSAQLNGNLDSTGGLSCDVWFEYGETTSYGSSTTKQSKSSTGSFNQAISSLDPNTTYHFRAKASNTAGSDDGADRIFTTLANAPGTAAFSNVTTNSIRANWTANGNPAGTQYYCENTTKGTNSGWTSNLDWNSTGLSEDTTYHFQVKAKNGVGIETGLTDLGNKKTNIGISVTTNNASSITSTSAQLNGNLDDTGGLSCQVWFEYGKTTSYGSSTPKQSKSSPGPFDSTISGLDHTTTYHFRACASNTEGTVYGADKTFTTPPPGTGTNLELTPATQTVLIGAKGTVNVVVEDVTNLMGADITLNFDDSILKYDSSAPGSFWSPEGLLVFSPLATGGSVNIQLSAEVANAKSGSGTIITVTFERIASGVTDICFGSTDLRDDAWQVIPHTKGGCCSFSECIGDFNGDLQVNFGDLGIFAMAYRSTVGDDNWNPICDLDGDGSVAFNDLGIFAMHYRDDCRP